ncbi:tyrosine-type recombinase/integrase [Endozoicomonas sp.]|uniref:tyrosine-type recombinase/integrase n=1 Tax=Endozoicomonas sp. TaxID=1892382 RepID=UPI00383B7109
MPIEIKRATSKSGSTVYVAMVRVRKSKRNQPQFSRNATERFTSKQLAKTWGIRQENAFLEEYEGILLGHSPKPVIQDITLKDYIQTLLDYMPSVRKEDQFSWGYLSCLKKWQNTDFATLKSSEINEQVLTDHLEMRITDDRVTPATNSYDLAALEKALKWQKRIKTPFQSFITADIRVELYGMKLIGKSRHKDRRPSTEEFLTLFEHFSKGYLHPNATINYPYLLLFSTYSCFRISEVCRIKWSLYNPDTGEIIIEDRKDPENKWGNHEKVPLNDECRQLLKMIKQQPGEDRIFPYKSTSISTKLTRITSQLSMTGLSIHCLRHEAISRLFELGFTIPQVAIHSGHKNWANLKRYTHLTRKNPPDLFTLCLDIQEKVKNEFLQK